MSDFSLTTDEPSVAFQIWTRLKREPKLASNLTVERLHSLPEFRHLGKNTISAAVTSLAKRFVIGKIARGEKPDFRLSAQAGFDLGQNYARDEAREKQLRIARALPLDVIEQALAERRLAERAKETPR